MVFSSDERGNGRLVSRDPSMRPRRSARRIRKWAYINWDARFGNARSRTSVTGRQAGERNGQAFRGLYWRPLFGELIAKLSPDTQTKQFGRAAKFSP